MASDRLCMWLHEKLEGKPLVKYPFELSKLPDNGIYFFYEKGEFWGHGNLPTPRIVRVGTHRDGNFRSRITQHFLTGDSNIELRADRLAPKDRSIFRKNIGRAILARENPKYLPMWEIDFTTRKARVEHGHRRDLQLEASIEKKITQLLRENFSFRFVRIESQSERMGSIGLESRFVGTLANCEACSPSPMWLGNCSPEWKIRNYGLWQVQHVNSSPITQADKELIERA